MSRSEPVPATSRRALSHVTSDALVGAPPYWVSFMRELQLSLGDAVSTMDAHVQGVDAAFGEYGSLVLARVLTNQGVYLLVDTVNGTVAGPYEDGAALDARALLATHAEYAAGQTIEYFTKGDCATAYPVADTKVVIPADAPPTGWLNSWDPIPARPPRWTVPGNPTSWDCTWTQTNAGPPPTGDCTCLSTYTYQYSGSPCPYTMSTTTCLMFETWECKGTGCGEAGCTSRPNGDSPPGSTPAPFPGFGPVGSACGTPCSIKEWYYWQVQ